jgi:hypothetical protein
MNFDKYRLCSLIPQGEAKIIKNINRPACTILEKSPKPQSEILVQPKYVQVFRVSDGKFNRKPEFP